MYWTGWIWCSGSNLVNDAKYSHFIPSCIHEQQLLVAAHDYKPIRIELESVCWKWEGSCSIGNLNHTYWTYCMTTDSMFPLGQSQVFTAVPEG